MKTRLWPHQKLAVEHVLRSPARTILIQSPVATGKTTIYAELVRKWAADGLRVVVVAHRAELITQGAQELRSRGLDVGVIRAGMKHLENPRAPVQVASIQTLSKRGLAPRADVIVIDEAHHAPAKTYRKVIEQYPKARIVGLTATPVYRGASSLADCFEELYSTIEPAEAVAQGIISPWRGKVWLAPSLGGVKRSNGDFAVAEISAVMSQRHIVGDIVSKWKEHTPGVSTILFAATREQCKVMVKAFRKADVRAEYLDGTSPSEVRAATLERFNAGEFPILCNVGLFTEGTNIQRAKCIILARPTYSLALFLQMVGRGRRVWNNEPCVIHDHGNLLAHHGGPDDVRDWRLAGKSKSSKLVKCPNCHAVRSIDEVECPSGCVFEGRGEKRADPSWVLHGYEYDAEKFLEMLDSQRAAVRRLYVEERLSTVEIERRLGIPRSRVYNWGAEEGWLRSRTDVLSLKTAQRDASALAALAQHDCARSLYADDGLSPAEVGKRLKIPSALVRNWAKAEGWLRPADVQSNARVEQARKLYVEQGLSLAGVAKQLNAGIATISKWGRLGGWARTVSEGARLRSRQRPPSPARLARIEKARKLYVDQKLTLAEVAKRLGTSERVVQKWGKAGGWARTRLEARKLRAT